MILFLAFTALISCTLCLKDDEDNLDVVLKSPKATLKLYNDFKSREHLNYSSAEDPARYRLFRTHAQEVNQFNHEEEDAATYKLNFFSTLTDEEAASYTGLNLTMRDDEHEPQGLSSAYHEPARLQAPSEKLWIKDVTPIQQQGSCGSCWTYAAVGALETRYKLGSGRLRKFAEQEFLSCVYEGQWRNACNGGWPKDCYRYSARRGGRLAAQADYPYQGRVRMCSGSSTPNAMVAMKIIGYQPVGKTEAANIAALASGPLSVCFAVTEKTRYYRNGIFKDLTCGRMRSDHAVTAVGYTSSYILVKNSWGKEWGDQGYIKFARNYRNCNLFENTIFPILGKTGKSDSGPDDERTDYKENNSPAPKPKPKPTPSCKDAYELCAKSFCKTWPVIYQRRYCQRTCGHCPESEDKEEECPPGLIKCRNGECNHAHFC